MLVERVSRVDYLDHVAVARGFDWQLLVLLIVEITGVSSRHGPCGEAMSTLSLCLFVFHQECGVVSFSFLVVLP